jgi:hypothetical protein
LRSFDTESCAGRPEQISSSCEIAEIDGTMATNFNYVPAPAGSFRGLEDRKLGMAALARSGKISSSQIIFDLEVNGDMFNLIF